MKFKFEEKEYLLEDEKLVDFFNDEENPIENIDANKILNILDGRELDFEKSYYSSPCAGCFDKEAGRQKAYPFLEYHFYLYTKDKEVVISSLQTEEENTSFVRLKLNGKVDNSYIVSVIVCMECGEYTIEIEEFEI